jgi:hypothetical protein
MHLKDLQLKFKRKYFHLYFVTTGLYVFCKLSRMRWAGHVIHKDDDDLARRVLLNEPGGKRPRGRPRLRWEDGVKEHVAKLGCTNWSAVGINREGRRKLLKKAETHPGLERPLWALVSNYALD